MVWRAEDPQGNEAGKVKYEIVPYTRRFLPDGSPAAILDMGCGPNKAFPHFIGVDDCTDTELFGIPIKPDVVCDVADPKAVYDTFQPGSVDAIFSSHCLEHIEHPDKALRAWWDLLKVGGHLILYLPHRDFYPRIGEPGANPDHKHDFSPHEIIFLMDDKVCGLNADIVVNEERNDGMEYSFLLVFQKLAEPMQGQYTWLKRQDEANARAREGKKTACVVRYGGFGDMLQAANLFPALKREGYHVTVMTTPRGHSVIQHDPNVDAWIIQDDDQVPNHELSLYWRAWSKKFDKFVQLSESIEGTLLALPGRANHMWPDSVRRARMGLNYLEWTSELAGVPYESEARFYATVDEAAQVQRYLGHVKARMAKVKPRNEAQKIMGVMPTGMRDIPIIRPVFHIMWALSGSSVHKFYPWMDAVIARILVDMPEAAITFTGDVACQILEAGWEEEPRIFRQSGEMNIRQTLALAQRCDMVVGPETGVLNAVAFEHNVSKVVLLSHSSKENLSKHWVSTVTIAPPPEVGCYPCHRMHYGREFCHEHKETGAALCQVAIDPSRVFNAIAAHYAAWKNGEPYESA